MSYITEVLADSPVGYWRFEEQAGDPAYVDTSGNSNSILVGGVPAINISTGVGVWSNRSRLSNQGLTTPVEPPAVSGFTYETWFKSGGVEGIAFLNTPPNTFPGFTSQFTLVESSPGTYVLRFGLGRAIWGFTPGGERSYVSTSAINILDGEWHHLVATWGGVSSTALDATQLAIYVDGVQRDDSSTRYSNSSSLIAPRAFSGEIHLNGPIAPSTSTYSHAWDETAIYEHVLNSARVVAHFNNAPGLLTATSPEVANELIQGADGILLTVYEGDSTFALTRPASDDFTITVLSSCDVEATLLTGDDFLARETLDLEGTLHVDLSSSTLETDEPNAASYTGTNWYEIPLNPDSVEQMRFQLTSATSTGKISIYKSLAAANDDQDDVEPTFAELSLVQVASTDQILDVDPDYENVSYYIQIGLLTGPGDDFVFTWADADPDQGEIFDNPIPVIAGSGRQPIQINNGWLEVDEPVPSGITPVRSGWLMWTAGNPATNLQYVRAFSSVAEPFSLAVYTGASVDALTEVESVVGDGTTAIELSFVPDDDETYYIQITSESESAQFTIGWNDLPVFTASNEVVESVRVEVYDKTGTTLITELLNRTGVQFQEMLNAPGSGSVTVHQDDDVLRSLSAQIDPTGNDPFALLAFGNVIKFWLGTQCVCAIRIQERVSNIVSDAEEAGRLLTVSGPTVLFMLEDFSVKFGGNNYNDSVLSGENRIFGWNSKSSPAGGWVSNPKLGTAWGHHINSNTMKNPPGKGGAAAKRPKYSLFKKKKGKVWPTKAASKWMWISQNASKNGGWKPPQKINGLHYYRKNINIVNGSALYRITAAADDRYTIYVDGEAFLRNVGNESYKTIKKKNIRLTKGSHTIAVVVQDRGWKNGDKAGDQNDAFLFSLQRLNSKGKGVQTILASNGTWQAHHGPQPPGWNTPAIFRTVLAEAQARGNESAQAFQPGFTKTNDSNNQAWGVGARAVAVKVGTSALNLQAQFSESNRFDVWIDPTTTPMTLHAAVKRGRELQSSIALIPGYNLISWSVTETDEIKNAILVQYDEGGDWVYVEEPASIERYGHREGYIEGGGYTTADAAIINATSIIEDVASPARTGESPDIVSFKGESYSGGLIARQGAVPFIDFTVGDSISAPRIDGSMASHRVLSLTCTEDENGRLTFDPELARDAASEIVFGYTEDDD